MTDTRSPRPRWLIPAVIVAVLVVAGVAGVLFFFSGDDPDEVSLEAAVAAATSTSVVDETATTQGETATTQAEQPGGIEGTWAVDTSIGSFDFESASGSFVGFRIRETLGQGIGETEAVGRTGDLSGTLEISGAQVTTVSIEADLSTLTTDISQRNSRARGALNTSEFPIASFVLTEPIDLPAGAGDGEPITATASGELTVAGTTNPVTFDIEAQLVDGIIVVVASTEVTFADFGVSVPSASIVLGVDDFGVVEMQLLFSRS